MKEEILSIVTHALMGIDVEKETVDLIVNQCFELNRKSVVNAWNSAYGGDSYHDGEDYANDNVV